jgi:hypothetical protein
VQRGEIKQGRGGFGPASYGNSRLTFAAHHQRDLLEVIVRVIGKAVAA